MKSFLRSLSIDSRRTVVRESLGSEYWLTAYAVKKSVDFTVKYLTSDCTVKISVDFTVK